MKKIEIAGRAIGAGEPCFIIAEAGVNHNGDVKLAKKLIDVAKKSGADAVKFQTFKAEEVVTRSAAKAAYQKETTGARESQYEMIARLELAEKDFIVLSGYARGKGIIFLSTPFDVHSVDFLSGLGVPAFKVGSGEITNFPLLGHIARQRKPVILSTGMSTLDEVKAALDIIYDEGNRDVILLHCVSCYPARVEDMNLKVMDTLRRTFKLPVGLSDHSTGTNIAVAAAALGACVIEKHFTLDKSLPGPDHRASLEPGELEQMVKAVRDVEKAMGSGVKEAAAEEEEVKVVARRSLVAVVDIPQGTTITGEMLAVKRPGGGIEPGHISEIIGKKAKRNIIRDSLVRWEDV